MVSFVKPLAAALTCAAAALVLCGCAGVSANNDLRELSNLAACYTEGIDAIGAGKTEVGAGIWKQCFAEDVSFTLSFGPSFSVTCPGDKCPMPATMSGLQKRVAMARGTYDRSGYVATSHHITTLGVDGMQGDSGRIKGHLQAWHVRKDGATVLGLGTWEVEARKTAAGWRIVNEKLESPLRVVMPKAE
jgi:SnoaL-like domain